MKTNTSDCIMRAWKFVVFFVIQLSCFHPFLYAQKTSHSCKTPEKNQEWQTSHPESVEEREQFEQFTKQYTKNHPYGNVQKTMNFNATYRLPVVFHVYGNVQNGKTITLPLIEAALDEMNKDFNGLNSDFGTVHNTFMPLRGTIDISFELAQIDPNGNPTTGVEFLPVQNGFGNGNGYDALIAADAWDNYKYINVYLQADLYNDGDPTNSGVAWYPTTSMSDAGLARIVYNGAYLGTNTDVEFASTLTHEFGHFLNLIHTFENGCSDPVNDMIADTPPCDLVSDDCHPSSIANYPLNCNSDLINAENYMDYRGPFGCYKMFTQGQITRMEAALQHPTRFPLWQTPNLIVTGLLPTVPFVVIQSPTATSACAGQVKTFTANALNAPSPTYQWKVDGVNVGTNSSTYSSSTLTSGQVVTCVILVNGQEYSSNSITVTVYQVPPTPTITANSPICNGATLNLTTPFVSGATYSWTGPNGFTSGSQNPSIPNTTNSNSGNYSLIIKVNNCPSSPATSLVDFTSGITPLVSIATPDATICQDESTVFTATPVNGGSNPVYQWKINGVNTGLNSPTFTSTTLNNSDVVTCVITSSAGCLTSPTANSNGISMNVIPKPATPAITSNSPFCLGASLQLSTSTVANASYLWTGPNGFTSTAQNPTVGNTTLNNIGDYSLMVTVNGCSSNPANSTVGMSAPVTPELSVAASTTTICQGEMINFNATAVNGGNAPSYQWQVNGTNVGTNSPTFSSSNLLSGNVTCVLTSSLGCTTSSSAISDPIAITVNPIPATPVLTSNSPICSGATLTLSTAQIPGATYLWSGPNSFSSTDQNPQLIGATAFMEGTYSMQVTKNGCVSQAGTIAVTVTPSVTPDIDIVSSQNPACSGEEITFTTTISNGGNMPAYQWLVNGLPVSTAPQYASSTLNSGATVSCILTSNATCATQTTASSNPIVMVIGATLQPSVTINTSTTIVCSGSSVTFTAIGQNGGALPTYSWFVNGVVAAGQNSPIFNSSGLNNGDQITCLYTSNASCASPSAASSQAITMQVSPYVTPSIQIAASDNTICQGESVQFTSNSSNQGNAPLYQWLKNGLVVGSGSTYTASNLQNNDMITCTLYSNAQCATTATSNSNAITITVNSVPAVSLSSNSPLCEGETLELSAGNVAGGVYSWSGPTFSSSTQNPSVPNVTTAQSGTYVLTVTANNCEANSTLTVLVNDTPSTPVITQSGSLLTSSSVFGNQWYRNGQSIPGAVNQSYQVTESGNYTVIVTNADCPSESSLPIFVSLVELSENGVSEINLYPNPTAGIIHLDWMVSGSLPKTIIIYSPTGQLISSEEIYPDQGKIFREIDLSDRAQGIYFIRLIDPEFHYDKYMKINRVK